jgi:hypothetical protein
MPKATMPGIKYSYPKLHSKTGSRSQLEPSKTTKRSPKNPPKKAR